MNEVVPLMGDFYGLGVDFQCCPHKIISDMNSIHVSSVVTGFGDCFACALA